MLAHLAECWNGEVELLPDVLATTPVVQIRLRCGFEDCLHVCMMVEHLRTGNQHDLDWAANRLRNRATGGGWQLEPAVRCPLHVVPPGYPNQCGGPSED